MRLSRFPPPFSKPVQPVTQFDDVSDESSVDDEEAAFETVLAFNDENCDNDENEMNGMFML